MVQKVATLTDERRIAARIELKRPLIGHQGPINAIALRELAFGDYVDCGSIVRRVVDDPRNNNGAMRIEIVEDYEVLLRYAVRLSGLPEALLRTLTGTDARALKAEVERLVAEFEQGNSPTAPTNLFSSSA